MKLYSIFAFVTFALAAEDLTSPNAPVGLRARAIGSKCSHNGESGSCQKTSTCANDNGWYSDGDCKKDPTNVKCCMYDICSTGQYPNQHTGWCLNRSRGGACSGGTWYKNKCPGGNDVQCCIYGV